MPTTHMPITITVRRHDVDLFDVDCVAGIEYDKPDGQDVPNWEIVHLFFETTQGGPSWATSTRVDPALFAMLCEHLPYEYIATKLSEMLDTLDIGFRWEGPVLVVPAGVEDVVDSCLDSIDGRGVQVVDD